jgi:uncharacterized protein YaaQ
MKMIVAIIHDHDSEPVSHALIASGFRATRIASTGGFLRRGSSTLMIGVDDEKVDEAIQLLKENTTATDEPGGRRGTLFVLDVKNFTQI